MNFLQVCPHYVPAYEFGGPLQVAHSLGKALKQQGHDIHVCTTNLKNSKDNLDVPTDVAVYQDNLQVFYEPTLVSRYWGFSPKLYRRINREMAWADIVFIHFHYQFANWAGAYISRYCKKPFVIFAHGSFNQWGIKQKNQWKKQIYLRILEHRNIVDSCFIAFNAEEERELSLFSEKGKVIPSGVDPTKFVDTPEQGSWRNRYPLLKDKLCYLYLGRLNPSQKGLDLLLLAFAQLVHEQPNIHLVLAGPDERGGEAIVRRMIQELGITQSVTLTGMVSGRDKLALLNDCDVYVLASPSEGTSIALLEAMYAGLPVIVTNRVGLSTRIAKEQCGFVINRDEKELVDALQRMANSDLRAEMGKRSRQLIATEYTWDIIAKKLIIEIETEIIHASHLAT
jgi:glycosyltransferase involved in cell wall biosynthesis